MVLFMTVNSINGTLGSPAGWTLLRGQDGTATRGRAWTKQATAADAGANVTVVSSATIKDTMSVAVYRSDAGTSVGHRLGPDRRDHLHDQPHRPPRWRWPSPVPGW